MRLTHRLLFGRRGRDSHRRGSINSRVLGVAGRADAFIRRTIGLGVHVGTHRSIAVTTKNRQRSIFGNRPGRRRGRPLTTRRSGSQSGTFTAHLADQETEWNLVAVGTPGGSTCRAHIGSGAQTHEHQSGGWRSCEIVPGLLTHPSSTVPRPGTSVGRRRQWRSAAAPPTQAPSATLANRPSRPSRSTCPR